MLWPKTQFHFAYNSLNKDLPKIKLIFPIKIQNKV